MSLGEPLFRNVAPVPDAISGRIAVKVNNPLGDEAMKVFVGGEC